MLFSLATLKAKLIAGGIILVLIGGAIFYVIHLQHKVDNLKADKIELSIKNETLQETVKEESRRQDVVEKVTVVFDKERAKNEAVYNQKVNQIDEAVTQGKDRPVGPLLTDFFNRVYHSSVSDQP